MAVEIFKKVSNHSFSIRLSIWITALTALIFVAANGMIMYLVQKVIRENAIEYTQRTLNESVKEIDRSFREIEIASNNIAPMIKDRLDRPESMMRVLHAMLDINTNIFGGAIAIAPEYKTMQGKEICPYLCRTDQSDSRQEEWVDHFNQLDWYVETQKQGKSYWTKPYKGLFNGKQQVSYCVPLYDDAQVFYGVLNVDFNMDYLHNQLVELHQYANSISMIQDQQGNTLMSLSPNKSLDELSNEQYVYTATIPSLGWTLTTSFPEAEILQQVHYIRRLVLIISIIGLSLLLLSCWIIILQLARPIRKFAHAAWSIANGNFQTKLPKVYAHDELYQLRYSLDEMQHSLTQYVEDLKETTEINAHIENELQIAGRIQRAFLPKTFPPYPEWENHLDIYASITPAKEVGGDLYDFFLRDSKLYFTIADVSGKGMPAALFMAVTRSLFQHVVSHYESSAKMVRAISNSLSKNNQENMFVTLFLGILDLETGRLNYCNAGHNPPVLLSKEEPIFLPAPSNIPVGVMKGFEYQEQELQLQSGQGLFLYTDGVTEAIGKQKEMFGEERMMQDLRLMSDCSSKELVTLVSETIKEFTLGEPQTDDITLLHIKWKSNLN